MKIGIMFGNPETTPGGLALKFYSSIRIEVRKIETLKKGDQVIGAKVRIKIVKNKVAPPFKEAVITITKEGIDKEDALLEAALNFGIITKTGSFIKYADKVLGQGREAVKELLTKNENFKQKLTKEVYGRAFSK